MSPIVSIIILNYRSNGLTRECIKSVFRNPPSCAFEIIVVDNGGEDELEKSIEERYPQVRYIKLLRNVGFARGNNIGAREAKGAYLVFLNQDITVQPHALDRLVATLRDHQNIGIAAPRLVNPDGSVQQSCFRWYRLVTPLFRRTVFGKLGVGKRHLDSFLMKDRDLSRTADVDTVMGAVIAIRRSFIEQVGLFDERFFFYFEDVDLCRRSWERNLRVCYVPTAEMIHLHSRDSAKSMGLLSLRSRATRLHLISAYKYFIKYWCSKPIA